MSRVGPADGRESWVARRLAVAPGPVLFVTASLAYLAAAQLVMWLNDPVVNGASLWPAAGVSLGLLLLVPTRQWGWVLAGIGLAELGGDLAWGYAFTASLGWVASNTLEPLVGAWLLRRAGNARGDLAPAGALLQFLALGVVVGPLVGATVGAFASAAVGANPVSVVWPQYFVGDALGVLVVAPVLLARPGRGQTRARGEMAALAGMTILVSLAVFTGLGGTWMVTMPYLLIPFLAWAALRFGTRGTAWTALAVTLVANFYTVRGEGPFATAADTAGDAVLLLQIFLAITVSFALLLAALVSDLSDRRDIEAALRHQARHDTLTGLANRAVLAEVVGAVCEEDGSRCPGVLMCDLDDLKGVNDRLGHACGDELLVEVARRISAGVRPGDVVARLSGDEFVVVVHEVDEDDLLRVAHRVARAVAVPAALSGGRETSPSVSVGAALRQQGESAEAWLRIGDQALYEAKRRGRGHVVLADDELRRRSRVEVLTEGGLPAAISGGQLVCFYQPVVDLVSGRVAWFEASVRWQHPELGLLDAARFMPAVEATGLGDRLLEDVLRQALHAQQAWLEHSGREVPVAVNVSARQLGGGGLCDMVVRVLGDTGAPATALRLEVTKETALDDPAVASLHRLYALGVRLVLDGFGNGWSSMSRLSGIPWAHLKIDRSFVADLDEQDSDSAVVVAMVAMARALGLEVGADGVARQGQREALLELGCDVGQGDLFGGPVPADAVTRMLVGSAQPDEHLPDVGAPVQV